MVQTIYIYNQCDMVAEQPQIVSKEKVRKAVANFSLFTFPLKVSTASNCSWHEQPPA